MSVIFELCWSHDRTQEAVLVFKDGRRVSVGRATYDEHAWSGLDLLKSTVEKIGEALGIAVEEV